MQEQTVRYLLHVQGEAPPHPKRQRTADPHLQSFDAAGDVQTPDTATRSTTHTATLDEVPGHQSTSSSSNSRPCTPAEHLLKAIKSQRGQDTRHRRRQMFNKPDGLMRPRRLERLHGHSKCLVQTGIRCFTQHTPCMLLRRCCIARNVASRPLHSDTLRTLERSARGFRRRVPVRSTDDVPCSSSGIHSHRTSGLVIQPAYVKP